MSASPFSKHYSDARMLFTTAASSAGAEADTCLHPAKGPGGEELTTDVVDDDVWRGMILGQALAASRAALAGLGNSADAIVPHR